MRDEELRKLNREDRIDFLLREERINKQYDWGLFLPYTSLFMFLIVLAAIAVFSDMSYEIKELFFNKIILCVRIVVFVFVIDLIVQIGLSLIKKIELKKLNDEFIEVKPKKK